MYICVCGYKHVFKPPILADFGLWKYLCFVPRTIKRLQKSYLVPWLSPTTKVTVTVATLTIEQKPMESSYFNIKIGSKWIVTPPKILFV